MDYALPFNKCELEKPEGPRLRLIELQYRNSQQTMRDDLFEGAMTGFRGYDQFGNILMEIGMTQSTVN
jgi:hypothetical protein